MHQWQSQDLFVKELEQEYEEKIDPLNYVQVKYKRHEWDNIPPVVPKFCLNLSHYMDGLSKIANYESKLETVASLRDFSEKNIQRIDSTVSTLDQSRTAKELSLTEHVQAVDDFSVQLRKDYQKWQDNLYFARTFDKSGK